MSRPFVISIDTREQAPLPMPRLLRVLDPAYPPLSRRSLTVEVREEVRTLGAADYAPPGDSPVTVYGASAGQPCGVVERKFSLEEMSTNTLQSERRRANFIACLKNMRHAWGPRARLLLDGGWSAWNATGMDKEQRALAQSAIMQLELEYGIPMIPLGTRTPSSRYQTGEWVARWLWHASRTGEAP